MADIVFSVEALPCGQLRVEATAERPRRAIVAQVDGVGVINTVGHGEWTGDAFATADTARVTIGDDVVIVRRSLDASVRIADPGSPRAGSVGIGVVVETACPMEAFEWSLTISDGDAQYGVDGTGSEEVRMGLFRQGVSELGVELYWHGRTVATAYTSMYVGPWCGDADGDLACDDAFDGLADCDDADPSIGPMVQDVLGDGVDNDCDGRVAGDEDGDGYEAWTCATIPREGVVFDCDDTDPYAFPGAFEEDDGLDENCDGRVGEARRSAWFRRDGRFQLRDGATVRSFTGPIYGGDLAQISSLRTGTGLRAWLIVVDSEWSASMGGRADSDRAGYVVVEVGARDLRLESTLALGGQASGRGDPEDDPPRPPWSSDTRVDPKVLMDGLIAGEIRYRWVGDALVATVPPSPTR